MIKNIKKQRLTLLYVQLHKGGEFAKYADNGDGHGFQTGFVYSGKLSSQKKSCQDCCLPKQTWCVAIR